MWRYLYIVDIHSVLSGALESQPLSSSITFYSSTSISHNHNTNIHLFFNLTHAGWIDHFRKAAHKSFTIYFNRGVGRDHSIGVICKTDAQYERFFGTIKGIIESNEYVKNNVSFERQYMAVMWNYANPDYTHPEARGGVVTKSKLKNLLQRANYVLEDEELKQFYSTGMYKSKSRI